MTLYEINHDRFAVVPQTNLIVEKIKEREDLQALIKFQPEVILKDILIVSEEFKNWEDSQKRIDLLGIDRKANLIVIELKRTEDGGFMDLQAIRYAAMISPMTFDMLVDEYQKFLKKNEIDEDAKNNLSEFLDLEDTDILELGQNIQIVLASEGFSKELTTSVLWLNEQGLDIKCVRIRPYNNDGQILLDFQTIIPLPEIEEYQIQLRDKRQSVRIQQDRKMDFTKYNVLIGGKSYLKLNKRRLMYMIFSELLNNDESPEDLKKILTGKLKVIDDLLEGDEVRKKIMSEDKGGKLPRTKRFFCGDNEPIQKGDKTYVLSNQWGKETIGLARDLSNAFPKLNIEIEEAKSPGI